MRKNSPALLFLCALICSGLLMACRKEATSSPAQNLIVGKWTIETAIGKYTQQGNTRRDTTYFTPTDYIQFNSDGTLSINDGANKPTGKWMFNSFNKLIISETNYMDYPEGFKVSQITGNKLQLYYTESTSNYSLEQMLNLSR